MCTISSWSINRKPIITNSIIHLNTHMEECTDFFQVNTQRLNYMSNVLDDFGRCEQIQM